MKELDREVLAQLHVKLTDEDVIWDLCTERVARWRQAHARPVKERANHAQQIKRLEREISNLSPRGFWRFCRVGISEPVPLPARTVEPSVPVPSPDPLPVRPTKTAMH